MMMLQIILKSYETKKNMRNYEVQHIPNFNWRVKDYGKIPFILKLLTKQKDQR